MALDLGGFGQALGVQPRGGELKSSEPNLEGLDENLKLALNQARTAYREKFGREMPITSGVRTTAEQSRLYEERAKNPNLVAPPGQSLHEAGKAVDIPASVPEEFLNQHGIHRPLGSKDPVHATLMPTQTAEPRQGAFDLGGFQRALGVVDTQEPSTEAKTPEPKPVVKRMFEPKTELDRKISEAIESIPGSKELAAFGNVAAGTISKSMSSVQQLVGKYFPGLSDETRDAIVQNAGQNIKTANLAIEPFQKESPKAAIAGEVAGFIGSPVSKLVPGFGAPAATLTGAATKAGAQGAVANVLVSPAEDENKPFITQKLEQAATGGFFGAPFGAAAHMLTGALSKGVDSVRKQFGGMIPSGQIDDAAAQVVKSAGVDPAVVGKDFFNSLTDQAKSALKTGDVQGFKKFAQNYMEANELGVPMLRGQLTRDPMQYAVEQNLRGIQGVGEPIQQVLQQQNTAMLNVLDRLGATKGQSITNSGFTVRNALLKADEAESQGVRDAYNAYRQSSGRNIDVPLQGVAQDYAKILHDFGKSQIPPGVRNNLNELGLLTGKQMKVTTIDDAERIIKVINQNYDPAKQPAGTITALDNLRASLNRAIYDAGANLPGQAGQLAREARKTAETRFKTIDSIPALKDALIGKEPDKFVQSHILRGNVNEITKMKDFLEKNNPETLSQIQNDLINHIKNRVTNNVSDANAKFSQAGLKDFVTGPMADRLKRILTPDQFEGLTKLNRVAENALIEPVSSAVNRSNTASAAANLIKGTVNSGAVNELLTNIAGIKFPGVTTLARMGQEANQRARAGELIQQAITPTAPPPATPIRQLVRPGIPGAGLGVGTIQQRNVELQQ